jgi:small subunit ribosomal protein S3Ae
MAVQKSVEKWKAKRWFNIYAPAIFGDSVIGEIPGADEKAMIGRVIKVNMSWVTHNPQHSFITVAMKISDANGDAAHTTISSIEQTYSFIHSLVKRGQSAIYTVDNLKDKSGKPFVLKLLIMTSSKIATPKKTAIRGVMSAFLKEYAASMSTEDFVKSTLDTTFQQEAVKRISNIAEISKMELKKIEL